MARDVIVEFLLGIRKLNNNNKNMKVLFLDESGDHSLKKIDNQFPLFCLAGCIFDEDEYLQKCDFEIDLLKIKYFDDNKVIFHSREIRKCEGPFNILLNKNTKENFYADLNKLIKDLPFLVLASVIKKQELKDGYFDPSNPYNLSLHFLIERFLYFLEENNDIGYISVESRDSKSNADLLGVYTLIMQHGSNGGRHNISPNRFKQRIQKIEFIEKKQNHNGHQISDLIAYPIARYVGSKENKSFDVIKHKFRSKNGRISGYGLKIFP